MSPTSPPVVPDVSASAALAQLAMEHRLAQLSLLDALMTELSAAEAVTHLLVRGSLATGTADRLSDVDLVVGVRDAHLPALLESLDTLMSTAFGALLPGWPDTIVGDLGGIGYVYLLPHGGRLLQLDLYLCPASAVETLRHRVNARLLWQAETDAHSFAESAEIPAQAGGGEESLAEAAPGCSALLVQALVLHSMLRKRIARGQSFIAYGLLHQVHETLRDVIRTALVPHSRHYGWYHLPDEVGSTAAGRECLAELTAALSGSSLPTVAQADEELNRLLAVAGLIAPHAVHPLAEQIAAYRAYQHHGEQEAAA
jgi:predicted nucleotidyltransferase